MAKNAAKPTTARRNAKGSSSNLANQETSPMNCSFSASVSIAIEAYRAKMGLTYPQDVVRLATAAFLRREGFMD